MNIAADLKFALRSLRSRLGLTLFAAGSLAVGMAAAIAIYCVIDAVMLRALPYPHADRLVQIRELAEDGHAMNVAGPNYTDLAAGVGEFDSMAIFSSYSRIVESGDTAMRSVIASTSDGFFKVLGATPMLGRTFTPDEHDDVAVISNALWQSLFQGRADVLGQRVVIDGKGYAVAGVIADAFAFPEGVRAWVPYRDDIGSSRSAHNWRVLGRLGNADDLGRARLEASALATRLKAAHGSQIDAVNFELVPLAQAIAAPVRSGLLLLAAGTAFLLLIAITNTTHLLLALNGSRSREFAVRAALGASDLRLAFQVFLEGFLIVLMATLAALALAAAALRVLVRAAGESLPHAQNIYLDGPTILMSFVATLCIAVIATAAVLWSSRRTSTVATLRESGRGQSPGRRQLRTRSVLLVAQTALTTVLLIGAALLGRSFLDLLNVDPGFNTDGAVTVQVSQPWTQDAGAAAATARKYDQLMQDFAAIPGVSVVGGVSSLPLTGEGANGGFWDGSVTNFDQPPPTPIGDAEFRVASPGYFDAAGIPVLSGRAFSSSDRADGAQVALISASAAKATWGEQDPIGKQIQFGNMDGDVRLLTIVGVVGDVRQNGLDREAAGSVYVDLAQRPLVAADFNILVRTSLPIASVMPSLRGVLERNAKGIPYSLRPLAEVRASSLADRRFSLMLLGTFACVAFTLAVSGLYGLMAFAVGQRQNEFALRQALGSTRERIARLVLEGGMRIGVSGVVLGAITAVAATRMAGNVVHGVPAIDIPVLIGVCVLLLATLLLACLLPAHRASAVAPRDALA
ncbi:MAG TPA: ADOP family duplicated permease [Dokdonella sp.]|uniref:ADOP family duplicated permease n=1 Tax=Dokdonella sp. TaxID=2291710 RepID=UPI002D7FF37E|nr:ADOP family duplicated permease [Dokdonella sp.]HET9033603.1 ADOP family duplicated permease [Dokdonella sp.]